MTPHGFCRRRSRDQKGGFYWVVTDHIRGSWRMRNIIELLKVPNASAAVCWFWNRRLDFLFSHRCILKILARSSAQHKSAFRYISYFGSCLLLPHFETRCSQICFVPSDSPAELARTCAAFFIHTMLFVIVYHFTQRKQSSARILARPLLSDFEWKTPKAFWRRLAPRVPGDPFSNGGRRVPFHCEASKWRPA